MMGERVICVLIATGFLFWDEETILKLIIPMSDWNNNDVHSHWKGKRNLYKRESLFSFGMGKNKGDPYASPVKYTVIKNV